jgi:hypothetical protein
VTGDCHAGICGSPGVQFPRATRRGGGGSAHAPRALLLPGASMAAGRGDGSACASLLLCQPERAPAPVIGALSQLVHLRSDFAAGLAPAKPREHYRRPRLNSRSTA